MCAGWEVVNIADPSDAKKGGMSDAHSRGWSLVCLLSRQLRGINMCTVMLLYCVLMTVYAQKSGWNGPGLVIVATCSPPSCKQGGRAAFLPY